MNRFNPGLVLALLAWLIIASGLSVPEIVAQEQAPLIKDFSSSLISAPPAKLMLDSFYEKYADAMGIPIVASAAVSDTAVLIARDIVIHMLSNRPDLRLALVESGQKIGIIGKNQQMSDIPEYKDLKKPQLGDRRLTAREIAEYDKIIGSVTDAEYWNKRARGLGGVYTTCGEENLLGIPGTRYFGEHILVHEFGHAIQRGIRAADPQLAQEIDQAYRDAMAIGHWKGQYAETNSNEYWCEGTQFWFWSNYAYKDGDRRIYSPADLREYDPRLYELLGRVYPSSHRIPMDVFYNHEARSARPAKEP